MANDRRHFLFTGRTIPSLSADKSARSVSWNAFPSRLVGLFFLGAALLKTLSWREPTFLPGFVGSPQFRFLLIETESGLGLALLCNFWPRLARAFTVTLLAVFFGWNLYQTATGARTCACLGFELRPWFTAVLDLILLGLLWRWAPPTPKGGLVPLLATVSLLGLMAVAIRQRAGDSAYPELLTPTIVDLGTVTQGRTIPFTLRLRNPHARTVVVSHVKSVCPCFQAMDLPWELDPLEEKVVRVMIDFAKEPAFSGDLELRLRAETEAALAVFETQINVTVQGAAPA